MREGISRSRQNRIFGGVAAGLGEYLNIDPIVIRVLFVVAVLLNGIGILLYLIMWIVLPEDNYTFDNNYNSSSKQNSDEGFKSDTHADTGSENINFTFHNEKKKNGKLIFGITLVIIGMFFLGVEIFSFLNFADLVPVILIGVGITILWKSKNK